LVMWELLTQGCVGIFRRSTVKLNFEKMENLA
jgi:hypothetical protein